MDKKTTIFIGALAVLLLLAAVYSLNTTRLLREDYRRQLEGMTQLLSQYVTETEDLEPAAPAASELERAREAQPAPAPLEAPDPSASRVDSDILTPLHEGMQRIAQTIDQIDVEPATINQLDALLRGIYKELGSLDLNVARLAQAGPLSQQEIKEQEAQLGRKIKEVESALQDNRSFASRLSASEAQLRDLQERLNSWEQERVQVATSKNKDSLRLQEIEQQEAQLRQQLGGLQAQLAESKTLAGRLSASEAQLRDLQERINSWEQERVQASAAKNKDSFRLKEIEQQEAQLRQQLGGLQNQLSRKIKEVETAVQNNKILAGRLSASEVQLKRLEVKIDVLEEERAKINEAKKRKKRLTHRLGSLEQRLNKLAEKRKNFEDKALKEE